MNCACKYGGPATSPTGESRDAQLDRLIGKLQQVEAKLNDTMLKMVLADAVFGWMFGWLP